jgi:hypothetical protein
VTTIIQRKQRDECETEGAENEVTLSLVIFFASGRIRWFYEQNQIIIGPGTTKATIVLNNLLPDGMKVSIDEYATTGISRTNNPIAGFSPSSDGSSAKFELSLLDNQLIDFGVFVLVNTANGDSQVIFCDPQASNDPKLEG